MNYKERLIEELKELSIRIDRLQRYLENQNINEDFELEEEQLKAMKTYRRYLEQRILKLMK